MFLHDLKLAFRSLLRSPGLLVSAVVCLALGIGLNAALLGLLDLILLRAPAHVQDADSLRRVYYLQPGGGAPQSTMSYPMVDDLAGKVDAFSGLAAYYRLDSSIGLGLEARKVRLGLVTASFFPVLGVQPVQGRVFSQSEGHPEHPAPVALVSWELWQRAFDGAPDIVGKPLRIEGQVYTVVGVLPRRFTGVDPDQVDVWLPVGVVGSLWAGPGWSQNRSSFFLGVVGRLRPGVSAEQAAQQATAVHRAVYAELGDRDAAGRAVLLGPVQWGRDPMGGAATRLLAWLVAGSAAVFCVACANVASLLIVRGLERHRELAMRLALGASRSGLARLLLAEGVLLAIMGGVAALAVAQWGGKLVGVFLLPEGTPYEIDLRLLAILSTLSLGAGLLCGLGAALWGSREDAAGALRNGAPERSPGRSRLRVSLLVAQVAFTFLLLMGAGLFLRSLRNVQGLALGLEPERLLVATVNLQGLGWTPAQVDAYHRQALERVRALPGVERASLAAGIPFRSSFGTWLTVPGYTGDVYALAPGGIYYNIVTEDFFSTLGTPLRQGRGFTARDDTGAERVAVVNETMAKLLWPGQDPLGRCFQSVDESFPCITVVGVTADARRVALLGEPPTLQFYLPMAQAPGAQTSRALFVRGSGGPERLAGAIRREMQGLVPDLPFVDVRPLSGLFERQLRPWQMGATVFTLFGLLALGLAVLGIFAAVAQAVASRADELGIRMALGADFKDLLWLVLRSGFVPVALGLVVGLGLALWLGRLVEPLLFEVSTRDPGVASAAVLALLAAAVLASLVPALRVRRLDPAAVMRTE
jgi:putative ABC transport system permease protein